jgi:hypothetical protein
MLGTNKTATTKRLVSGNYIDNLVALPVRYEPIILKESIEKYKMKEKYISFELSCNKVDIIVSDRILVDSKEFVVVGLKREDEGLGKHFEVLMREIASSFHETVIIKTLSGTQNNYDPILLEWNKGPKSFTNENLSVLLDHIKKAEDTFRTILSEGKFIDTEYIMTVDLPIVLTTAQRIEYKSELYIINWIEKYPFETLVGLKKDFNAAPTSG